MKPQDTFNTRSTRRNPNTKALMAHAIVTCIMWRKSLNHTAQARLTCIIENNIANNRPALAGTDYSGNPEFEKMAQEQLTPKPKTSIDQARARIQRRGKPTKRLTARKKTTSYAKSPARKALAEVSNTKYILSELQAAMARSPLKRETHDEQREFSTILKSLYPTSPKPSAISSPRLLLEDLELSSQPHVASMSWDSPPLGDLSALFNPVHTETIPAAAESLAPTSAVAHQDLTTFSSSTHEVALLEEASKFAESFNV